MMSFGLPNLSGFNRVANAVSLIAADADAIMGMFEPPKWGIFDKDGNAVLSPDAFVSVEYSREWRLSDFPIEEGAFASYNKVVTPKELRVVVCKGGAEDDRAQFISALEALEESLDVVSVVTPEATYSSLNVAHLAYARSVGQGAGMVSAEISLREVRLLTAVAYSQASQPSGADAVDVGTVTPADATNAQTSALAGG